MFKGNYIFYFAMVAIVAGAGSYFTMKGLEKDKYKNSKKPSWYPPGYAFSIAWSLIYLLYIYSWTQASYIPKINILFTLNMIFNLLWTFFFFYLEYWSLALFTLIGLVILLITQITELYKYNMLASLLLIPYLGWSVFATYLNYTMIDLN
jgi:tryptophan-rich sensory protein